MCIIKAKYTLTMYANTSLLRFCWLCVDIIIVQEDMKYLLNLDLSQTTINKPDTDYQLCNTASF